MENKYGRKPSKCHVCKQRTFYLKEKEQKWECENAKCRGLIVWGEKQKIKFDITKVKGFKEIEPLLLQNQKAVFELQKNSKLREEFVLQIISFYLYKIFEKKF